MRRMAVRAIINNRRVFPQEWTALLRVAGITGLIHRFLHQQLRPYRPVRIMAIRTGNLSLENRMAREAMNLCALILMATETNLGLRKLVHHLLVWIVCFMTIGASESVGFMRAACP